MAGRTHKSEKLAILYSENGMFFSYYIVRMMILLKKSGDGKLKSKCGYAVDTLLGEKKQSGT
ncbi:MAG: hypothetical protein ACFE8Z_06090 [Candidatus Hermodarchaeota archaeon]